MKTTKSLSLMLAATFAIVCAAAGCQTGTQPVSNAGSSSNATTAAANTNQPTPTATATTNASQQASVTTESDKSAAGSLATPTEAYKTAYTARQNKDLAGLKRVMSQRLIGFLTEMGEAEKKSLDDQLKELFEQPQAATSESRNEKITGDKATLEYPDEEGKWKTMDFVKEGGGWKMTLPSAQSPGGEDASRKHK
jgi:cytoskeletal protein RodZ